MVIRVNKTKGYTVMSNYHLVDKSLSLKAKGLLSVMLSLPEEWNYTIPGLVAICKENETAVKSALNELKKAGYLVVTKKTPSQTKSGRFEYEYDVYEKPIEKQETEEQETEKQGVENLGLESLGVENLGLYKRTKEEITKEVITKEKEEKENKKKKKDASTSADIEKEFEDLWQLYPRKQGKANAKKAYLKARKEDPGLFEVAKRGIENYKAHLKKKGTKPEYVKMGSTWFSQRCWEDEYEGVNADGSITGDSGETEQPCRYGVYL